MGQGASVKRTGPPTGWRHRKKAAAKGDSANSRRTTPTRARRNPIVIRLLAIGYGLFWIALAITPKHRADWLLENLLVFAFAGFLVLTRKSIPFSTVSYGLIAAFMVLHAVGAHYTYSETPIGYWIQDWLAQDRNHYDRVIHFAFGLLMFYPLRELVTLTTRVRGAAAAVFAFCGIAFFSTFYELLEWGTAQIVSPETAMAFLGTQGDVFDAQKDSALALIGALIAAVVSAGLPAPKFRKSRSR